MTLSSREPFEPREYFAAALPFFERIAGESDSDPLTPLLLVIIYGMTDASGPSSELLSAVLGSSTDLASSQSICGSTSATQCE